MTNPQPNGVPHDPPPKQNTWQIDKRIPLALILTVSLQTVAVGVWVGGINSRVSALETATAPLLTRSVESGEKLARMDEKMSAMQQQNTEIKDELRRLALRGNK